MLRRISGEVWCQKSAIKANMISIVDLVNELLMLVSKNIMKKTIGKIQTNQSRVVIYVKKGNKQKQKDIDF